MRVNTRVVNRKVLESLIKAGAFDRFNERSTLLHNLDTLVAFGSRIQKDKLSGQTDLFGNLLEETGIATKPQLKLDKASVQFSQHDQLTWERELLGLYLSKHPLELYGALLSEQSVPLNSLLPEHDGKSVTIGGSITDVREITTKNGQKMAFVKIEDQFGDIEAIIFPGGYQRTTGVWQRDRIVLVKGKLSAKDRAGNMGQEIKILVDEAREITPDQASSYQATGRKLKTPKAKALSKIVKVVASTNEATTVIQTQPRLYIRLSNTQDQDILVGLKQIIDKHIGDTEVVLVLGADDTKQIIKLPTKIQQTDEAINNLAILVGADNVKLK
jgi:DNA polymerase-3 subunit alpha